ncbi:MAG: hypothetical protein M3441_16805 [Chloroflexota bacterium]|nr:hypothetical protein [Chloroflexota bacterium]
MTNKDGKPYRAVEDNVLVSEDDPAVKVRVAAGFSFVGELEFILYDVAYVNLFVFVRAEPTHPAQIVVQFEHYLEDNDHTYTYESPGWITLGEHEYIYDVQAVNVPAAVAQRPDSDAAQVMRLVSDKGYPMPDEAIFARFVRMLDDTNRRELLIIYSEPLSQPGLTAADLQPGWRAQQHFTELCESLIARALQSFEIIEG